MQIKYKYYYWILMLLLNFCSSDKSDTPDVSKINIKINYYRFDNDLFSISNDSLENGILNLEKKYDKFFDLFCSKIINIGQENNRNFVPLLQKYISDYNMITVYNDCKKNYNNIGSLTDSISNGFKFYKYYFPNNKLPDLYFYMGGFNQSIVTSDGVLGIGLEKYLGENYIYYKRLGLAKYQCYRLTRRYILPDCFKAIALSEFPMPDSSNNLLNSMIYQGKVQYFVDKMLPELNDTIKFGFTSKQWEWCLNNENLMWSYLIDKKQLFITNEMDIKRYIDEAPFTTYFPHESPGRTGVWIGWRIVNKYMKNNPKITLEQLMNENNYQKILDGSKYNP